VIEFVFLCRQNERANPTKIQKTTMNTYLRRYPAEPPRLV